MIARRAARKRDASPTCEAYYGGMQAPPAAAVAWCRSGRYFSWRSTLPENAAHAPLNIFWRCAGDRARPAILLIHGYPTSSFDFAPLAHELSQHYHVFALDTPGYGFSDKPRRGYRYSLFDDARLVDHFVREVARLDDFVLFTHDKGDSVGLALLQLYQAYGASRPYRIGHHFITNGNVYLPLARLTLLQRLLLHPIAGRALSALMSGAWLARRLGRVAYSPPLGADDVAALASIFEYQDGMRVQHDVIQYLDERKVHEVDWLQALARSDIPTTLVWGERDTIAPTAVADYLWSASLVRRSASAASWRIPCANHCLQSDHPALLAAIVRATLEPGTPPPTAPDAECQPVRLK